MFKHFLPFDVRRAPTAILRWRIGLLFALSLAVLVALMLVTRTLANTVIGDGTPASCTNAALQAALNTGGTITFNCGQAPGNPVTIAITQTLTISGNVTLDGGAAAEIILDGGDTGSGARSEVGLLNIAAGAQVEVREITLNRAGDSAIRNDGSLTLHGVEVYYARAFACAGVQSTNRLIVREQSIISTNQAETEGGGVCILGGTAAFEDSAFQFNSAQSGGGLYMADGTLTSQNTYFGSNSATLAGAAIFIAPAAQAQMAYTGIADNVAQTDSFALGGGIYNQGLLNLFGSVITNNSAHDGGGIYNTGNLTINASDVEDNTAEASSGRGGNLFNSGQAQYSTSSLVRGQAANGGGFYNSGLLTLTNATISQNTATLGGNLSGGGELHLRYSTLVQNTPQDLYLLNADGDTLGSIFTTCLFDSATLTSLGNNLDAGDSCGFTAPGDLTNTDPLLGALESSEGRYTWYHAPAENSPAIDGGEPTCPEAENRDQHNAQRPAGSACDIGAMEVGGVIPTATPTQPATAEPTTTPTPQVGATATRTASPTPTEAVLVTPTATPEGPYVFPAPQTTPQSGFTIQLSHSEGRAGDLIQVTGSGASRGVRLTWANDQVTFNGADVPVQADGSYQATLPVPEYIGDLQVCAATGDPRRARFICTNFYAETPEDSSLVINFPDPLPVHASVQVLDHAGNILYNANGENDTSITLTGLTPGAYHLSVTGASYALGQVSLAPGLAATTYIPKLTDTIGVDPVTSEICTRSAATGRVQAKYSYTGFYTATTLPDPVARRGAMAVEKAWVSNNFSYLAPQAEFGTFISGVPLANEFRANLTGNVGSVQKVEYWVKGEGQATWTKIGESATAPYAVTYNIGSLPPGAAQMLVAPVINNQRQCGTIVRVNMVANPVDNDFISNKIIVWSASEQVYRFTGFMPNFPFLPFAYQSDPWEVDPLGDIATVLNAGVRVVGTIQLNQVMHLSTAELETTVQVLGVRPEGLNNQINLLPGGAILVNPNNPQSLALSTGRMHLGELFSISVNTPKIVAFSYFGIVNAYVRFSFGMQGDLYMQATLYPLSPALEVIVEPQATAKIGVIIGADVLFGLVDGSAEVGAAASLGLPLRVYAAPQEFSVGFTNPNFCLYGYIQFHWSAVWGAFGGSSPRQPFFDIPGGCAPNQLLTAETTAPPRVLTSPVLAGDANGQMLSVYIEDAAPNAPTAAPVVMARHWDVATQNWLAPVPLTQPGSYVASPTVALLGESNHAIAAWVQSNQTEAQSQAGDMFAALNEMEIFAAFYDGAAWSEPFRLTEDSLPDGSPTLAADEWGATLAWVHHSDGDLTTPGGAYVAVRHWDGALWSSVEFLDGGNSQTGANPVTDGTRQAANNSQPSVARTTLGAESQIAIAWTYEVDTQKRVVVAHNRAQTGVWYMLDTSSLPLHANSPFVTLPAGQAEQVELAFSAASPGADGNVPNLGNLSVIWTARLLDQGDSTAVTAAPLQDAAGTPVRGEKPELQIGVQGERLLTFRQFGAPGNPNETGQIAVSRAVGSAAFAAPLSLTSGAQHWQGSAFINPTNNNLMLLSVQVNRFQPLNAQIAAVAQPALPTQFLTAAGEDALLGLAYPAEADPAIVAGLQVSQLHLPVGQTAVLTATVQNLGRDDVLVRVRWWQGDVETGTLLATSGLRTLAFNEAYLFAFALPVSGGSQTITAEVVPVSGNRDTGNDTAAVDVGALPAPRIASISPAAIFENALQIAYHPAAAPGVAGYRILRRVATADEYQLVGETVGITYYDASLQAGNTYCYVVQAYDASGQFSDDSPEECRMVQVSGATVYLPLIVR